MVLYLYNQSKKGEKHVHKEEEQLHLEDRVNSISREMGQLRGFIGDYFNNTRYYEEQPAPQAPQGGTTYEEPASSPPEDDGDDDASSEASSSDSSSDESEPEQPPRCVIRLNSGPNKGSLCGRRCPPGSSTCKMHAASLNVSQEN